MDNPNVRECVTVGNFDAHQEGDLTFVVNISLQRVFAAHHSELSSNYNEILCFWDSASCLIW